MGIRICEGLCVGLGTAATLVKGACPDPCDDNILDLLEAQARTNAKAAADEQCLLRGGETCECIGEFTTLSRSCRTVSFTANGLVDTFCFYNVQVLYDGDCGIVV